MGVVAERSQQNCRGSVKEKHTCKVGQPGGGLTRQKHILVSVALLAVAVSAPAVAADMPVRRAAAAPAAVTNWSGCYIGGYVGYAYGHSKHRSDSPFGTTAVNVVPQPSST